MPIVKNDEDCCVYKAPNESGVILNDTECVTECNTTPKDTCGATHPVGSGTIAGCNSTTLPHFGVTMGKREGNCVPFGYYTSGNTKDYENLCGDMEDLSYEEVIGECVTSITYSSGCRVPCPDKVVTQDALDAVIDAQAAIDAAQDENIAANVDNTDTGNIVVEDGVVYTTLEDGAKVPQAQVINVDGTLAGVVIGG